MDFSLSATSQGVKLTLWLLFSQYWVTWALAGSDGLSSYQQHTTPELLSFSKVWWGLGPFRIGTREAIWGADPLAAYGGFVNLPVNESTAFRSPLTRNASIQWTSHLIDTDQSFFGTAVAALNVGYSNVDWDAMQRVYGWSALQFQCWIRGELVNHAEHATRVLVYPEGILEFYVNDQHVFGGDVYSFDQAPLVVDLKPGTNIFHVRLIRDVRAMGGQNPPFIQAGLRVKITPKKVHADTTHAIVPDMVDGKLPSHHMSVPILNTYDHPIELKNCERHVWSSETRLIPEDQRIVLIPGQTRRIAMKIQQGVVSNIVRAKLCYNILHTEELTSTDTLSFSVQLVRRSIHEPHKFTFLHPSQAVSYALIQPPKILSSLSKAQPPLVLLHGAGLEADSYLVRHVLDEMPNLETFAIFPSGMTPWSGDDWHVWGLADVVASIDALHDWVQNMNWKGPPVSTDRVLIAGHSNGGQGTWYFVSHLPDRTVAAVPASGYTSIENYVPYNMWSEADPLQSSILHMARISSKNELLLENLLHIPLLQQHGSEDDNVPPYHSRLMSSLREELGSDSSYVELPNEGHWWTGAMTTEPLKDFFERHLTADTNMTTLPTQFALVSPATDEMGSKFGIVIDQLETPDYLGRMDVKIREDEIWDISTSNVRKFTIDLRFLSYPPPTAVILDSSDTEIPVKAHEIPVTFARGLTRRWSVEGVSQISGSEREGAQRGALDAIMRTTGPFQIVSCDENIDLALQISRNMLQYYRAESHLVACTQHHTTTSSNGNVIRVVQGKHMAASLLLPAFPVAFSPEGVSLRDFASEEHLIPYQDGLGGIFLRPHIKNQLELVVWGVDEEGLRQAARLVPTVTGGGQPDFMFLGRKAKWQGHGGVIAMGFFDYSWNISKSSYLP